MIFTVQHAWQSESVLSVFTTCCLQTGRREHNHYLHWEKMHMKRSYCWHPTNQKLASSEDRMFCSNWNVCKQELVTYHQDTKSSDFAQHVAKLPCETAKANPQQQYTANPPQTKQTELIIYTVSVDILHFTDIFYILQDELDLPVFLIPYGMCIYPGVPLYSSIVSGPSVPH